MSNLYFEVCSDVTVGILVTEMDDASLMFEITCPENPKSLKLLSALQLNLSDGALADGMTIKGLGVNATRHAPEGTAVTNGAFDIGVHFDTDQLTDHTRPEVCFAMQHAHLGLTVDTVFGQSFAVNFTTSGTPKLQDQAVLTEEDVKPSSGLAGMLDRARTTIDNARAA